MKLILFDIDGTLLNSGPLGVKSLALATEKMTNKKPIYDVNNLCGRTDLFNFNYMYTCATGKKATASQLKNLTKLYLQELPNEIAEMKKAKNYKKVKGIEKFLQTLQKYPQVKIALATGNIPEAAQIKLASANLDKYFSFKCGGFGSMGTDRTKLLAQAVKSAEKFFKTKFTPNDVFIIGDTHRDIIAAKENGYHSAVVLEVGLGDKAKIQRAAAELELKDFTEIPLFLMWLVLIDDPKGVKKGAYITPATAIEHVFFSRTGIDEDRLKMFKIKKYSDLESGKIW